MFLKIPTGFYFKGPAFWRLRKKKKKVQRHTPCLCAITVPSPLKCLLWPHETAARSPLPPGQSSFPPAPVSQTGLMSSFQSSVYFLTLSVSVSSMER